MEYTLKIQFY